MTTIDKKKYIIRPLSILFLCVCLILLNVVIASTADKFLPSKGKACGSYQGHTLRKGPSKGACFFKDKNNKTVYVDKRLCNC